MITETAYGPCEFFGKDTYIGKSLYAYGEWSGDECLKILELANGQCLDIGANVGFMSMAMESLGLEVIAFEPQPEIYGLLRKNIRGNCMNVALGNVVDMVKMPRISYSRNGNYGGCGIGMKSELGTINVSCIRLDDLGLRPGFVKIDVEGYELEVLRGGRETILAYKPIMYIEDDRPEKSRELRAYIAGLGYTIEEHQPKMFRTNNFKGRTDNIWGVDYISKNIICRPC